MPLGDGGCPTGPILRPAGSGRTCHPSRPKAPC